MRATRRPTAIFRSLIAIFLLVTMLPSVQIVPTAHASTITVTNTNDSGAGSLRDAIANAISGDTITFAAPGTITLTTGNLVINKNLTITGLGSNNTTISGNTASRVFNITAGGFTVNMSGMTIENGQVGGSGGGINNFDSTVTITNCFLYNNHGTPGGGIYNEQGIVNINNSTISYSNSTTAGGGIFNEAGTVHITGSTLYSNSTSTYGGGLYDEVGAATTIVNS